MITKIEAVNPQMLDKELAWLADRRRFPMASENTFLA
jgi:hypothetical protein